MFACQLLIRQIESFAVALLDRLFEEFSVERITVRVRKETPVLDGIVDSVGVEMSRRRGGERDT